MSAPTKQEMLDNLETAINARMLGGAVQSYSINGRNIQYMTLTELRQMRADLMKEISARSGNSRNYATFTRPD